MSNKPNIIISSLDLERLERLLDTMPANASLGVRQLEDELERAEIVDPRDVPASVDTMNSKVRFQVKNTTEELNMTLVYPKDMDTSGGTISVLAPIGCALLGLSTGDEIEWPGPNGKPMQVRIEEILYQPERAGEFHR